MKRSVYLLTAIVTGLIVTGIATVGASSCLAANRSAPAAAQSAPVWGDDYYTAYRDAADSGRMLLVFLTPTGDSTRAEAIDNAVAARPRMGERLNDFVLCRLPLDATLDSEGQPQRLIDSAAFRELHGGAGVVIIDLENKDAPFYGHAVTALPLTGGKYYRWSIDGLAAALDLPAGTLSQRSLVWAVRTHPEAPQSTGGEFHPALVEGARAHAAYQARLRQQGHQNFSSRFQRLRGQVGMGSVKEVCAESWPNQTLIDSVVDCVASWRQSSGHWNGVRAPHRSYGYDIKLGGDGVWYATGLFAD
ncbi:hypothetical protein [Pseudobythopirellula maris]|nr:hypothetical protein [Pseudobythopirellula maris]